MQEAVSDILIERARDGEGISRMVAVSVAAHVVLLALMFVMPSGWLAPASEPDSAPMMISLGGSPGPETGGRQQESGRSVQRVAESEARPREEPPPAAKPPEMAPRTVVKSAPKTPPPVHEARPRDTRSVSRRARGK